MHNINIVYIVIIIIFKSWSTDCCAIAEKAMVMDMIRTAVDSKEDYYQRDFEPQYLDQDNNVVKLPPIDEKNDDKPKTINRYDTVLVACFGKTVPT